MTDQNAVQFVVFQPEDIENEGRSGSSPRSDSSADGKPSSNNSVFRNTMPTSADVQFVAFTPHESKADKKKRQTIVRKKAMSHFVKEDSERKRAKDRSQTSPPKALIQLRPKPISDDGADGQEPSQELVLSSKKNKRIPRKVALAEAKGELLPSPVVRLGSGMDPFDALPIKATPAVGRAFEFCQTLKLNVTPYTGFNTWGRLAGDRFAYPHTMDEHDPLMLATRLLCSTQLRDFLSRGSKGSSDSVYFETICVQQIKNAVTRSSITQQLCIAVAMHSTSAAFGGRMRESRAHLQGLVHLVNMRGGLHTFSLTSRRIIIQQDMWINMLQDHPLTWPSELGLDDEPVPKDLMMAALAKLDSTVLRLPEEIQVTHTDLLHLHIIGMLRSPQWREYLDHSGIGNVFFRIFPLIQYKEIITPVFPYDNHGILQYSFDMATKIYMRLTTRPFFTAVSWFHDLMNTLHLEDPASLSYWSETNNLEYLLWILSLTANAQPARIPGRPRILYWLGYVIDRLQIEPVEFDQTIREHLWTDMYTYPNGPRSTRDVYNSAKTAFGAQGVIK